MPAGRPTKYLARYVKEARGLCKLGATDEVLSDYFNVTISTITLWKKEHPEFSAAIAKAKVDADKKVADSLYKRATGMVLPDTHFSTWDGVVTATPTEKHIAPDTSAASFWLRNRQPKLWREKTETVLTDPDGKNPFDALAIAVAQQIHKQKA